MSTQPTNPAQKLQSDRSSYPGLLPREIVVLRAWLRAHEAEYDRFDYNVRIGDGFDPGPTQSASIRQMTIQNTQKRIDAVAYKGSDVTLIEVKDRAGFSAIGQLVGYRHLWQAAHPELPAPKLLLIANRFQLHVEEIAAANNMATLQVEVDPAELASLTPAP